MPQVTPNRQRAPLPISRSSTQQCSYPVTAPVGVPNSQSRRNCQADLFLALWEAELNSDTGMASRNRQRLGHSRSIPQCIHLRAALTRAHRQSSNTCIYQTLEWLPLSIGSCDWARDGAGRLRVWAQPVVLQLPVPLLGGRKVSVTVFAGTHVGHNDHYRAQTYPRLPLYLRLEVDQLGRNSLTACMLGWGAGQKSTAAGRFHE